MEPLFKVCQLSKSFGTLPAITQVSFEIRPGEVLGVAGESGSGKSVLARMIAGHYAPDSGEFTFEDRQLHWPYHARSLGIGYIPQKPTLVDHLDVSGNILLGNEIGWPVLLRAFDVLSRSRMDAEAGRILNRLGMSIGLLHEKAANLSSEERQMISIARVMAWAARLVLVDAPSPLLSYSNQQKLLTLIQTWQHQGVAVLFASDNLDHLFAVADRIMVLRAGRKVAEYRTDDITYDQVVSAMAGTSDQQYVTPVIWALKSYYRTREQAKNLWTDMLGLQQDLSAQDRLNRRLLEQLAEQVNALEGANLALQEAQRRLLTDREDERKRLARELHDQMIQDLLSLNYEIEELEAQPDLSPDFQLALRRIRGTNRALIGNLRHLCSDLRPPSIDSLGLGAALQSYCHEWSKRTGIAVTVDLDPNLGRLPEAMELSIFRIVQEALNNVRAHSGATAVQVGLRHTSPRTLLVSVGDNGRGLADDPDLAALSSNGHFGLLGIGERVALLGGRVKLQNQPGGGLLLQVEMPHPRVLLESPLGFAALKTEAV